MLTTRRRNARTHLRTTALRLNHAVRSRLQQRSTMHLSRSERNLSRKHIRPSHRVSLSRRATLPHDRPNNNSTRSRVRQNRLVPLLSMRRLSQRRAKNRPTNMC